MMKAEEAFRQLQPKINKSLYYTNFQDREDLEQELKMKITECINDDVFDKTPGFWEFVVRFKKQAN